MPTPATHPSLPNRWKRLGGLIVAVAALMAARPYGVAGAPSNQAAYDLIDEVNALRASNGLAAYNIDPILMAVAMEAEPSPRFGTPERLFKSTNLGVTFE